MASAHQSGFSRVRVDSAGRIVIPSEFRERHGIEPGQEVIISEEPQGLCLQTFRQAMARAQAYFAAYRRGGESVVDELIRDRREEAAKEDRD
jgi:AbrB family looped-hinge helix DNA binding protein